MEEIVLTSDTHALTLRNKGYRFKHIKTGKFYILITKIKSKNNLNGDWYDTCPECAVILTIKMN